MLQANSWLTDVVSELHWALWNSHFLGQKWPNIRNFGWFKLIIMFLSRWKNTDTYPLLSLTHRANRNRGNPSYAPHSLLMISNYYLGQNQLLYFFFSKLGSLYSEGRVGVGWTLWLLFTMRNDHHTLFNVIHLLDYMSG